MSFRLASRVISGRSYAARHWGRALIHLVRPTLLATNRGGGRKSIEAMATVGLELV